MTQDANDPVFRRMVDSWIAQATEAGARTFNDLVVRLPGVYPSVILARIQTPQQAFLRATNMDQAGKRINRENGHWAGLPRPHPLDFSWRFTGTSAAELARLAVNHSQPMDRIGLLGTPTVFLDCVSREVDRSIVLLDRDGAAIGSLQNHPANYQALHCDLRKDALPALHARVVIADPPWYEDELEHFLWACRKCCDIGAIVLLSCPPVGARPGVEAELGRIIQWAAHLGLELIEFTRDGLVYTSPGFERNALRAGGVPRVGPNWRRGDLAVFACVRETAAPRPPTKVQSSWWEEIISGVRFRIRSDSHYGWADPTLVTLVEKDVLASVSRRERIRDRVDVWTSGNRVFACDGKLVLREILRAIASVQDPCDAVGCLLKRALSGNEKRLVLAADSRIQAVIEEEQHDMVQ
jgi:hypothetical protein